MISFHSLRLRAGEKQIVDIPSLKIEEGDFVALVGESGSGKSLSLRAISGMLPHGISAAGECLFFGENILAMSAAQRRKHLKYGVAMVFQNPMHCLNPAMRCGKQIEEVLRELGIPKADREQQLSTVISQVELDEKAVRNSYPHQLSGGQKQRIMIAIALASGARCLLADEPTTALDALVQWEILELLLGIQKRTNLTVLLVSHDIPLVAHFARNIAVMQNGKIVEYGSAQEVMQSPKHAYTQALLRCRPQFRAFEYPLPSVEDLLEGRFPEVLWNSKPSLKNPSALSLEVEDLSCTYGEVLAVDRVSFRLYEGEAIGIIGASGSGKSTVAKALLRMLPLSSGTLRLSTLESTTAKRLEWATHIQMVFQDPYGSLNPALSVHQQLKEILLLFTPNLSPSEYQRRCLQVLEEVHLDKRLLQAKTGTLSGGQRQRLAISRALLTGARCLVLDESLASLDLSAQAHVLNVLYELKAKGFSFVFITHDISTSLYFCDHYSVLKQGKTVFQGKDVELLESKDTYVRALLKAGGVHTAVDGERSKPAGTHGRL